ncbi:hypothetical protein MXB_95, partial [Myxobolus squamalis]
VVTTLDPMSSYEYINVPSHISVTTFLHFFGYITLLLVIFVLIPSAFGFSMGFFKIYKNTLNLMFMNYIITSSGVNECSTLTFGAPKRFELIDVCKFASAGAKAIIEDDVLKRFTSEGKNNKFTIRVILMTISVMFLTTGVFILNITPSRFRNLFANKFNVVFCRISNGSMGVFANFHDTVNIPSYGVVVANHTSPIDVLILGSKNFYRFVIKLFFNAQIGQIQPGFFAYLQRQLSNMGHIFFERREIADRHTVAAWYIFISNSSIKKHATDPSLPPVIIFPEGTCINNTSVMQFRKGTFEVCDIVHPVAIKVCYLLGIQYNPMFGDAFWDSSKMSYLRYIISMASSWFVYCDVWFLPPVAKLPNEDAVLFARRVQKVIAEKAKMDGNLKRTYVPSYLKQNKRDEYAKSILLDYPDIKLTLD